MIAGGEETSPAVGLSPRVVVLTSLMAKRLERQKVCVESWQRLGPVFSFAPEEVNRKIQGEFPGVEFFFVGEAERGAKRHLTRINVFFDRFAGRDQWVVFTNSDIEWRGEVGFLEKFMQRGQVSYFRRKNYDAGSEGSAAMFVWGIDTVLFNGMDVAGLPRMGLTIGAPFWDYWIPLEMLQRGVRLQSSLDAPVWHENHGSRWDEADWFIAAKEFFGRYNPKVPPWEFGKKSIEIHRQIIESTEMIY